MKNRKRWETLLTAVELAALTGILMLSFYLLYGYFKEGEQAVSGTAGRMTEDVQTAEDSSGESADRAEDDADALLASVETDAATIRVRILDNTYPDDLFEEISVCSADGFTVERGMFEEDGAFVSASAGSTGDAEQAQEMKESIIVGADQTYVISAEELEPGDALRLYSEENSKLTVTGLSRADGPPEYGGELYIYRLEDGLALVNVLPLEEYLYAVVSSEMPSFFPEEAQKAQAICARTYALRCMEEKASGENNTGEAADSAGIDEKNIADLNDSAAFQVYNNRKSTEESVSAVEATRGEVLLAEEVQYYSTSVLSEHRDDLSEEDAFREFLSEEPEEGAEYGSSWLRWQVQIPVSQILENMKELYVGQWEELFSDEDVFADMAVEITVAARSGNGQAMTLAITAGAGTLEVEGEYAIRQVLSPGDAEVTLLDGTGVSGMQLLPSAFFYVDTEPDPEETVTEDDADASEDSFAAGGTTERFLRIYGGGYGHGNGMSQYGAAQMAADGSSYPEILEYYYGENEKNG